MAKMYIDTVKYVIYANIEIGGLVEKPDVVGAVFGQTEGLLGDELDLRELQKNGRIGRIEVDLQARGGKSVGRILLPSSLDMVETSILGAALETVDRVGPCDARVNVEKIEDTRSVKRKTVVDRAKSLLKTLLTTEIPESREISQLVRQEVKTAGVSEYGSEKLPSGPNITTYDSIIIVEGRADVINLLKNDINNVIAVGGANVPKTLANLCREKEVTVFLDGDRGGDIILKELSQVAEIDYIARAPAGKEVEELARKEIIKCLRSKVPVEQVDNAKQKAEESYPPRQEYQERRYPPRHEEKPPAEESALQDITKISTEVEPPQMLLTSLNELENTLRTRIYDEQLALKYEVPVRDLIKTLTDSAPVYAIVLDGIITQRLVDLAEGKGAKVLLGVKMGNIFRKPEEMLISTKF
ncbi:MAG: DNA primase, archaeal DnaG-type [Candidatus Fermentimicrarchaeum limneticum]|uniref:DNA primase DnaG n=1 Tax=Fermentimicrarchaeum limneticum TaxID=2795018 RepID=A0A7D6BP37_FERL1|nr:MAG: DNA primase, archaeal DnaG-type [Candidatus Fermentimicrarchaeum limneticum]